MRKYIAISLLTLLFITNLSGFEKVGVTSFQFLKISPDPTIAAMGGAYAAISRGTQSMYGNPAALVMQKGFGTFISQTDYVFDTKHTAVAASWGFDGWALGVFSTSIDYGSIEVTDINNLGYLPDGSFNPGLTGDVLSMSATEMGVGVSQRLTDKFSYGLVGKWVAEDFSEIQAELLAWDIGVLYNSGFRTIQLAASLRNFGPQVEYIEQSYPLPQTMNLGISAELLGEDSPLLLESPLHTILVTADLVQPRDYDQQYNVGTEYSLKDLLFVRAGYRINYDTEGFNMGLGFKLRNVALDYGFSSYGANLPAVHRFGIALINI